MARFVEMFVLPTPPFPLAMVIILVLPGAELVDAVSHVAECVEGCAVASYEYEAGYLVVGGESPPLLEPVDVGDGVAVEEQCALIAFHEVGVLELFEYLVGFLLPD